MATPIFYGTAQCVWCGWSIRISQSKGKPTEEEFFEVVKKAHKRSLKYRDGTCSDHQYSSDMICEHIESK